MFFVINKYRPLTMDAASTIDVMHEIETAAGISFTGIINNSNLGAETDAGTVLDSAEYARQVSALSGLPIVATAVDENIYGELQGSIDSLLPMKLQKRPV